MNNDMQEWMKVAKKYGAVFENVKILKEHSTFTVRAIDVDKEFFIGVPYPVLVPMENIEITDDKHCINETADIPKDLKAVLNNYLDFILSEERLDSTLKILKNFIKMPQPLKEELKGFLHFKTDIGQYSKEKIKSILLQTRVIALRNNKIFFMPFIDFIDHSYENKNEFNILSRPSVNIKGKVSKSGEIFATYNHALDPFGYLETYNFIPSSEVALSIMMTYRLDKQTILVIGRKANQFNHLMQPQLSISKYYISLSGLCLGSNRGKSHPYQIFKTLWEEKLHKKNAFDTYTAIKNININKLTKIIKLCENTQQNESIKMVKECAKIQLSLIDRE